VLNRAVAHLPLFEKQDDYVAFEQVLAAAMERERLPLFAYCLMPNHWHFVVRPETDEQFTAFFRWLPRMQTIRWHAHDQTQGTAPLPRTSQSLPSSLDTLTYYFRRANPTSYST
jgi:putative transposase